MTFKSNDLRVKIGEDPRGFKTAEGRISADWPPSLEAEFKHSNHLIQ